MKNKRGQILTYDAIGGVVIFMIAVGILLTYWSSSTASYTRDSVLVTQSNVVLDNFLASDFFDSHLHMKEYGNEFCGLLKGNESKLGLYNYYNLTIYDKENTQIHSCAEWEELSDVVVAQRIIFIEENDEKETAKVVLRITG
jgi:hypothetical protein